jgi:putative flippase GtrA
MFTFVKSQAASLIATCADFGATVLLVQVFGVWYGLGSVSGNVVGAVVHFTVSRHWVFAATHVPHGDQLWRYGVVWLGYIGLSFALLLGVTHYVEINYVVAKMGVAIVLSVSYNYVLQKRFVFK